MRKRIVSILAALCLLISVFTFSPVQAATKPPTPSVTISSPSNTTITLGQSFTVSGSGTNNHHLCGFVNGSALVTQNGNSYSTSYTPSSTGTYSVYIAGRNTASSTDPGTKLATSATRTVTVVAPTGTITIYSIAGATVSGQLSGTINSSGYYKWSNMAYGTYTFNVSKSGYNTSSGNSVTLNSSSASKTVDLTAIQTHIVKIKAINSANNINQTYTADGSKYSMQIYSDTLPTSISLSATDNGNSTTVSPSAISLSSTAGNSNYSVSTSNGSLAFSITIVKRASHGSTIRWHTDHMHVYQVKDTNTGAVTNVNFSLNVDSGANAILDNTILGNMVPNVVAGHQYQIYYSRVIVITVNGVVQNPLRDCYIQSDVDYLMSVFVNENSFKSYSGLYSFWTAPAPVPSVKITSPANNTTIILGQSVTIAGTGTNNHHICSFINGSAGKVQNGNSYSITYTPATLGTYTVFLRGRNTANDTDPGTQTADSSTVTFTVVAPPTSITVNVRDKATGAAIKGASISGGGSGSTNSSGQIVFVGLSYGTYAFVASKSGYSQNSSSAAISAGSPNTSITIYLTPIPVNGDITVTVKDKATNMSISGASIDCGSSSGLSNSNGMAAFTGLSFGKYNISASKSGYYLNSGSASISASSPGANITIYLDRQPTSGNITVTVRDKTSNAVLSGASVKCKEGSGSSNTGGAVKFLNIPFGTYTFNVSKSGYYSNTGNATISLISQSAGITIYLAKIPTVDLSDNIQTFGDVRTNTDVIFNVIVSNTGDKDIIPSDNVKVSLTAAGTTQTVQLAVPQNSTQIVPFRVHTPDKAGTITLTAFVDNTNASVEINESNNSATKTVNVYKPVIPEIPDPKATDAKPAGWRVPVVPAVIADRRVTWREWRYNSANMAFSQTEFYVETKTKFTIKPDSKISSNKYTGSEYITKSGYGIESAMTVGVTTNYDRSGIITPAQRVWVFTPESSYNLFRNLDLTVASLTTNAKFGSNKYSTYNARLHFTPVWYPDGYYTMFGKAFDVWTPVGELEMEYSSRVAIEGSVYDDWHSAIRS